MILASIEKIEFSLFGLDLLEPNAIITDGLLGLLSIYFAYKVTKLTEKHGFFRNWKKFLLYFGIGAILGGVGHTFYNYLGIAGKAPAWYLSTLAVYFIEFSMISIHPNDKAAKFMNRISLIKLVVVSASLSVILFFGNPDLKENLCILFVVFNTLTGVTLTAGALSFYYYRSGFSDNYVFMFAGVLIMIPSAGIFIWDVNLFQWFDKNDLSHLLLGIGIAFFYAGLQRLFKQEPPVLHLANVKAKYF